MDTVMIMVGALCTVVSILYGLSSDSSYYIMFSGMLSGLFFISIGKIIHTLDIIANKVQNNTKTNDKEVM